MRIKNHLAGFVAISGLLLAGIYAPTPVNAASCTDTVIRHGSRGSCVVYAQNLLLKAGHTVGSSGADGVFGNATANATLNFQRSQGLYDDAVIGKNTWARLVTPSAVPTALPSACKTSGTVLCASQATRKLHYVRAGTVIKTVNVRFGGWAKGTDGIYRIYRTTKGTYSVYAKSLNAWSYSYKVYMPYSLMYNGGQYIHQSNDFASAGYTGASHGCINVASATDAKWFYDNAPTGTRVVVF